MIYGSSWAARWLLSQSFWVQTPGYPVVYVGNIPFTVTAQQLRAFFQQCQVSKVRLHTDRHSGKFRGFAHVHLADEASADR